MTGKIRMDTFHIVGKISESEKYLKLNPLFRAAFAFLKRPDLASLPPGRHRAD